MTSSLAWHVLGLAVMALDHQTKTLDYGLIIREDQGLLVLCDDETPWLRMEDSFAELGLDLEPEKMSVFGIFVTWLSLFWRLFLRCFVSSEEQQEVSEERKETADDEKPLEGYDFVVGRFAVPERAFEKIWTDETGIYEAFLVAENERPEVTKWDDSIRRIVTYHPLAIPVPRWCGLQGLAIPTTKVQTYKPNLVTETSHFTGFPFATAMTVQTAWSIQANVLHVSGTCSFDPSVPIWLQSLVKAKSKDELIAVNTRLANLVNDDDDDD